MVQHPFLGVLLTHQAGERRVSSRRRPAQNSATFDCPIPADAAVAMELGTEQPVTLSFDIADGSGAATYLLSPRRRVA